MVRPWSLNHMSLRHVCWSNDQPLLGHCVRIQIPGVDDRRQFLQRGHDDIVAVGHDGGHWLVSPGGRCDIRMRLDERRLRKLRIKGKSSEKNEN